MLSGSAPVNKGIKEAAQCCMRCKFMLSVLVGFQLCQEWFIASVGSTDALLALYDRARGCPLLFAVTRQLA